MLSTIASFIIFSLAVFSKGIGWGTGLIVPHLYFDTDRGVTLPSLWFLASITFPHVLWFLLTKKKWWGVVQDAEARDYFVIGATQFFSILLSTFGVFSILASLGADISIFLLVCAGFLFVMLLSAAFIEAGLHKQDLWDVYKNGLKILVLTTILYALGAGVFIAQSTIKNKNERKKIQQSYQSKSSEIKQVQESVPDKNLITLPNGGYFRFGSSYDIFSPSGKKVAFFAQESSFDPNTQTTITDPDSPYTLYVYNFETKEVKALFELPEAKTFFKRDYIPENVLKSGPPYNEIKYPYRISIKWLSEISLEVWYYDEHEYFDEKMVESTKKVFSL